MFALTESLFFHVIVECTHKLTLREKSCNRNMVCIKLVGIEMYIFVYDIMIWCQPMWFHDILTAQCTSLECIAIMLGRTRHLDTENRDLSWCQIWWPWRLSLWQSTVPCVWVTVLGWCLRNIPASVTKGFKWGLAVPGCSRIMYSVS